MENNEAYDFSGWATKNDLQCSDGRTIRHNAFKENDGQTVPLVWNHLHNEPENVLGHALLENRDDGVYCYGTFNDTSAGQVAKVLVQHGDIEGLSIYANKLQQIVSDVVHGNICEVSLVHAGANPGAYIDTIIAHSNDADEEAIIYSGETGLSLSHSDTAPDKDDADKNKDGEDEKDKPKASQDKDGKDDSGKEDVKTYGDVLNTLTEEQKLVVYDLIGQARAEQEDKKDGFNKGGNDDMKHNVFDKDDRAKANVLSHAAQGEILALAKTSNVGTFQNALATYAAENSLQHDAISSGFVQSGTGNVTSLFPEYQDVRPGAPELITNDQGWISHVMNKVHKSPISRIRTRQVDVRNLEALRAKGYKKGSKKAQAGTFSLIHRTTDPQTVYVTDALNRDDVVDITDFDYVAYLYGIDRMMLNEELAMAIMLGDGREEGDADKIHPEHIRPIWLDDELYTIHVNLDVNAAKKEIQGTNTSANFGDNYIYSEAIINTVLYAREKYKGSGTPDFYCTPHLLNVMLLARDMNGRRIYSSKAELATALNVSDIITAEQFEGKTRTDGNSNTKKLLGIIANLNDYSLGATKGGEITHFTDFDIDFNRLKSLLETRCSHESLFRHCD